MYPNDTFEMRAFVQDRQTSLTNAYRNGKYEQAQIMMYIGKGVRYMGNWLANLGSSLQAQQRPTLKTVTVSRNNR